MITESMADLACYMVLAFAAAHFVAMFNWCEFGLIFAIMGADAFGGANLPMPILLGLLVWFTGSINLFVGSASAKWGFLAPVMVPMMMQLNVSSKMTTAAYSCRRQCNDIITPLMVYFPLILTFCQRWQKDLGPGSLTATMIPYSIWLLIPGLLMTMTWIARGLPLGPGKSVVYQLPAG